MQSTENKHIVLVLGSGGARGFAHIGVIEELRARDYRISAVVGCSMGALVGGVYCAGRLPEYTQWACSLSRRDIIRLVDFAFGHPGLIKGDRVMNVIKDFVDDDLIEDLPIAFTAVATDLDTRRSVWINQGHLFDAIRASIAIPMLLTPQRWHGRELVDGGLLSPVPVAAAKALNANAIIAVNVNADSSDLRPEAQHARASASPEAVRNGWPKLLQQLPWLDRGNANKKASRTLMDLMARSLDTMHSFMTRVQLQETPPDVLIEIPHNSCAMYEFWRATELVEIGRQAAIKALDQYERNQDVNSEIQNSTT